MKNGFYAILLLSIVTAQLAAAAPGDLHCTFQTNKGMAFLVLDRAQTGYRVDLNVMGERVIPYETARKSGNGSYSRFKSSSIDLALDLTRTYHAPMGNTGAAGVLSLKVSELGIKATRVNCEIKNQ